MKRKTALSVRSSTKSRRRVVSSVRKSFLVILFFPVFLLALGFVTQQSIAKYKQEQAKADLADNVQEALRSEGVFQPDHQTAVFQNEPISPLAQAFPESQEEQLPSVLGENNAEKWIDVDLSTQTLKAMEGDREVYQFFVSTGKWALTPTGEFAIWSKFKYAKMSGGSKELNTYYYLPNVPYIMFFHDGFAIHGAYWHNNFGHPMSHGCVNMSIADSERLFYWASPGVPDGKSMVRSSASNPGTKVVIHGVAPKN